PVAPGPDADRGGGRVGDVIGPEGEDPASVKAVGDVLLGDGRRVGEVLVGLDDRPRPGDLRVHLLDADRGQSRTEAVPGVGDVIGRDLALRGRVTDVDDRPAGGLGRRRQLPGGGGGGGRLGGGRRTAL